jgi:hypothetical protein
LSEVRGGEQAMIGVNENGRRVGAGHPRAKYPDSLIDEALRLLDDGIGRMAVAKILRIPYTTIRAIATGRIRNQTAVRFKR